MSTTPTAAVKKPLNLILGLVLLGATLFVGGYALAKGLKKGKE